MAVVAPPKGVGRCWNGSQTVMDGWNREPSSTKHENIGSRGTGKSIFRVK